MSALVTMAALEGVTLKGRAARSARSDAWRALAALADACAVVLAWQGPARARDYWTDGTRATADACQRATADALAGLRPAFDKAGSVTAGNASGINDGAAAVVVMTAKKAAALGLTPLARIAAFGTSGLDPKIMGMGPVSASRKALQRAGWKASDIDLFELNEAFAAQACAVNQQLDIDPAKVNVNGGAIAIGHPIGASGCRILVTLLHEMQRTNAKKGLAALCIGGGMGVSLALER